MAMKDGNDKDSPTDNKFLTFYNYPEVTGKQKVNHLLSMICEHTEQ